MEDDDVILRAIRDGIMAAQMYAMAAAHIVRELLIDVAKIQPNPERYVADLYDRVIAHIEPTDATPQKEVVGQTRDIMGAIFRDALSAIRDPNQTRGGRR